MIRLEGVTVIVMICPEGYVGNTISVLGGVLKLKHSSMGAYAYHYSMHNFEMHGLPTDE